MSEHLIIIGAGHAGGAAAFELRKAGYTGNITLIGAEPHAPYQRPPLSKAYLKGNASAEDLMVRPTQGYADSYVNLIINKRIMSIDPARQSAQLYDGATLPYTQLIIATGARCRTLQVPGADLPGVLTLRHFGDADALRPHLRPGAHLLVVGGGYIGLEAAAVARTLGCRVTVVEREPRLMARTASPDVAAFYAEAHRGHGIDLRFGVHVTSFEGTDRVRTAHLSDGTALAVDVVVVGIGVIPDTELAQAAGLTVDDGIIVDADACTSQPGIYAIGDVTRRPLAGQMIRLESVHNALEQGKLAAAHICGLPRPKLDTPWFWSDQYDLKLQIVGLTQPGLDRIVRRGADGQSLAVFHLRDGAVAAVEAVNDPAAFMAGKQFIQRGVPVDTAQLADTAVPLKALLSAASAVS